MTSYKTWFILVLMLVCLHRSVHAVDSASPEEAASYFESFYAQTADWGDFDVEIKSCFLQEELESSQRISERSVRERYLRSGDKKIFVRSIRLTPISDDGSLKPSRRLAVTILQSDNVALHRMYPQPTERHVLDEKGRTFEWVCNPTDFRLMGVLPFPFHGGSIAEEMVEMLRRLGSSPDPLLSIVVRNGEAVVSKTLREDGRVARSSFVFDIDRLLMNQRKWKLTIEVPDRLHQGTETYQWEKIDGRYRPTKMIGETIKSVPNEAGDLVRQLDQFEADFKWRQMDKDIIENPNELLDDPGKAMEFIGMSEKTAKDALLQPAQ